MSQQMCGILAAYDHNLKVLPAQHKGKNSQVCFRHWKLRLGYLLGEEKYSSFCSPLPCNVKDPGMINGILVVMLCREFNVVFCSSGAWWELWHAINTFCSSTPNLTAQHVSDFISFTLSWQEHHSSTSHSYFSFKALWRCPELTAGQRPPPGLLLPHLVPLVEEMCCTFGRCKCSRQYWEKCKWKIWFRPFLNLIKSCSSLWKSLFFSGHLKMYPLSFFFPTPTSEPVTFSSSLCHWKLFWWLLQSAIQSRYLPACFSGASL